MPTLEDLFDLLAAGPPCAFTRERDALAASLTKRGQAAVAAKVKARRAPTVPIWAINRLARQHPALIKQLVAGAERVGAAQIGGAAPKQLSAAMDAYRGAGEALLEPLDAILTAAGVTASHQVRLRIQQTLMAAAADPKVRRALLAGRLETEMTASGFDVFGGRVPAAPASREARPEAEPRRAAGEQKSAAREARARHQAEVKAAVERERLAAAERLRSLRAAAEAAAKGLEESRAEAERAAEAVRAAARRKREADRALKAAQGRPVRRS